MITFNGCSQISSGKHHHLNQMTNYPMMNHLREKNYFALDRKHSWLCQWREENCFWGKICLGPITRWVLEVRWTQKSLLSYGCSLPLANTMFLQSFQRKKRLKGTDEESNSHPLNCSIALYQYGHLVHKMMKTQKCYCKLFLLTCHLMAEVPLKPVWTLALFSWTLFFFEYKQSNLTRGPIRAFISF